MPASNRTQAATTAVSVSPDFVYAVNGISEIQAITGLVVNGASRLEHVEETRQLRSPSARLYVWAGSEWLDEDRRKGLPIERIRAKWTTLDFDKRVPAEFDARLGLDPAARQRRPGVGCDPQFWQLEQLQAWDLRRNIILHFIQPHPATEADFPAYGRYFRACLREIRTRYPDLGPLYVMVFNEPDFEYPRPYENRSVRDSVTFFDRFYEWLNADIHREFPEVTLLGPGISTLGSWQSWKEWVVPFLDQAPSARFFNCQPYAAHFSDLLAWTEMLQAESLKRRAVRLPLAITETNTDLDRPGPQWWKHEYHVDRVRDEAVSLFGMMEHPDQFAFREYFFYHYECNWHDLWFRYDGVTEPSPVYWLYWLLRDVRGTRVFSAVNREEDSELKTIAARDGTELTLALFNAGLTAKTTQVAVQWPPGLVAPSLVVESLRYEAGPKRFVLHTQPELTLPQQVTLAPGEIVKLRWTLSAALPAIASRLNEREYFSAQTALAVSATDRSMGLPARTARPDEVVLFRTALSVDDTLATERLSWKFNGHPMARRFAPPRRGMPILYVETAVPSSWVRTENSIEFDGAADASYRVMFASLDYRPIAPGAAAFVPATPPTLVTPVRPKPAGPTPSAVRPVICFAPHQTDGWTYPREARADAAGLHLPSEGGGTCLLLQEPLTKLWTTEGLSVEAVLGGFEKTSSAAVALRCDARLFFTPARPDGFIEPYVMSDMLCLLVEYRDKEDVRLSLYAKVRERDGFGRQLWAGSVAADAFPMAITLRVNREEYRVRCDKALTTSGGSLSGKHGLPANLWKDRAWFGIKGTMGNQPSADVIREVRIAPGRK